MNVVYLHCHDAGRAVEPYGANIRSPHLAEFARSAAVFRQAFTVNPTCSPSRCALLTGQYAHRCGMMGLAHRGFKMPDYSIHLAATLKRAGYTTALYGIQHETHDPEVIASYYDENPTGERPRKGARDIVTAEAACAYLKREHTQPFLLTAGFFAPHREFPTASPEAEKLTRPFEVFPDADVLRRDMADFQTAVDGMDDGMGRVLDALEQSGRAKDTIVICTTDHGPAFPTMKCTMRDGGLGVMLMVRIPGEACAGKVFDAMVTHLDVFPTLTEVLGLKPSQSLDGTSLLPLIRGETERLHEEIFAETNFHAAYEPQRAVRTDRWKYIRRYLDGPTVMPNIDDGPTKKFLYDLGRFEQPVPTEQLYDLWFDPAENCNLAAEPRCADVLTDLRGRLERWQQATDDPLLKGALTHQPGEIVTPGADYSPKGGWPDEVVRVAS